MDITAPMPEIEELKKLQSRIESSHLPPDLHDKAIILLHRLMLTFKYGGNLAMFDQVTNYVDWITSLPWEKESQDNLDLVNAKEVLDRNHYGLNEIKDRILEYLSVMRLNVENTGLNPSGEKHIMMRAPILFFVGLVGTGKTTMGISIAEAMNREFVRIPFGGMGSALDLRGQSRVAPDAEVGLMMKALRRAGTRNPVVLLDELDRVAEHARADIMGVLVELLDPEQNVAFTDHYIDFPFNLSETLFIATANNTNNIATAVLDRLEAIQMPSYSDEEKIIIGKSYIFPKVRKNAGLTNAQLIIDDSVWPLIIRPLGFDSGIRSLERTINGICRRIARMIVEKKAATFQITEQNVKQFLPTW